jgi:hypothetical protein
MSCPGFLSLFSFVKHKVYTLKTVRNKHLHLRKFTVTIKKKNSKLGYQGIPHLFVHLLKCNFMLSCYALYNLDELMGCTVAEFAIQIIFFRKSYLVKKDIGEENV